LIEILKSQIWVLLEPTLEWVLWTTGAAYFEFVAGRHAQYCVHQKLSTAFNFVKAIYQKTIAHIKMLNHYQNHNLSSLLVHDSAFEP
jgi:hypothetical protein